MKYRKKPIEVEAMEFTEESKNHVYNFIRCNCSAGVDDSGNSQLGIQTLEGVMAVNIGDYVIKGVTGEFYPCKPDVFELTYDKV